MNRWACLPLPLRTKIFYYWLKNCDHYKFKIELLKVAGVVREYIDEGVYFEGHFYFCEEDEGKLLVFISSDKPPYCFFSKEGKLINVYPNLQCAGIFRNNIENCKQLIKRRMYRIKHGRIHVDSKF